jgi:hypothetical protein
MSGASLASQLVPDGSRDETDRIRLKRARRAGVSTVPRQIAVCETAETVHDLDHSAYAGQRPRISLFRMALSEARVGSVKYI